MVHVQDLMAVWRKALDEKWGYIWGKSGQIWTASNQSEILQAIIKTYGKDWKNDPEAKKSTKYMAAMYGGNWIGKRVADCSGLAYLAFKECGGNMYHGSNTIWNKYVTGRCELKNSVRMDGEEIYPGDPVFLKRKTNGSWNRHHIGYYMGDGICIEAKGTRYGVVASPLSHWHETAHWKNVKYDNGVVFMASPTLRKGDSGEDVKKLQALLNEFGFALTVDGKFGDKTKTALMNFQRLAGIQQDGICGDQTWAALNQGFVETPENVVLPADCVVIPKSEWEELKKLIGEVTQVIKKF